MYVIVSKKLDFLIQSRILAATHLLSRTANTSKNSNQNSELTELCSPLEFSYC